MSQYVEDASRSGDRFLLPISDHAVGKYHYANANLISRRTHLLSTQRTILFRI